MPAVSCHIIALVPAFGIRMISGITSFIIGSWLIPLSGSENITSR